MAISISLSKVSRCCRVRKPHTNYNRYQQPIPSSPIIPSSDVIYDAVQYAKQIKKEMINEKKKLSKLERK